MASFFTSSESVPEYDLLSYPQSLQKLLIFLGFHSSNLPFQSPHDLWDFPVRSERVSNWCSLTNPLNQVKNSSSSGVELQQLLQREPVHLTLGELAVVTASPDGHLVDADFSALGDEVSIELIVVGYLAATLPKVHNGHSDHPS
jgi:hypothetical protein